MTPASALAADFTVRRGDFAVSLDLDVPAGTTLALLGPNGAGKSTAVAAIAGLVPLASGWIRAGGRTVDDTGSAIHVPTDGRRVGVVFQDYLLFPHLSVLQNVAFGPRAAGMTRRRARESAGDWLGRLGIAECADRRPAELSGGQAQRVALARALAAEPAVLLLDEPLSALDVEVRDDVRRELGAHLAGFGGATVVVTHSLPDARALGDEVIVLERGRITQRGSIDDLVRSPATPYIRRLVGEPPED